MDRRSCSIGCAGGDTVLGADMTDMVLAQIIVILLHAPSGHEIMLNPRTISTMHAAIPGEANKQFTEEARCVINTTDGKFTSTIETCDTIRRIMGLPVPKEAKK